jgi:2-polyprenyl-6-methoxyphenol hydroxylase-like FAD-dependent oxidoreductase
MAIEDAAAIGRCLSESPDIATAFERYERARVPRCNRVTRLSRLFGWCLQLENPFLIRAATRRCSEAATPGAWNAWPGSLTPPPRQRGGSKAARGTPAFETGN